MSRRIGLRTIARIGGKIPVPLLGPDPPYVAVRPAYTDSNDWQLPRSHARPCFYAGRRLWIFFRETDDVNYWVSYVSSADGKIWTTPTRVFTFPEAYNGRFHDVVYGYGYVHLVVVTAEHPDPSYVYYRRGTISGSTIVWEPWRTVTSSDVGDFMDPTINLDDQDYPWIASGLYIPYWWSPGTPYVFKSATLDGSEWEPPFQLTPNTGEVPYADNAWFIHIGSYASGRKMYAVYWKEDQKMFGRYYDGESWHSEEEITSYVVDLVPEQGAALVVEGKVYIVYKAEDDYLRYRIRDGTWGDEGIIHYEYYREIYSLTYYKGVLYLHIGYGDTYPIRYTFQNGVWSEKTFPWGETIGPEELFSDDFVSMDNWDPISGTWLIEAGELSGEHTTHGVCMIKDVVWNPNWKNIWLWGFIFRKSPGGGDSGIIFRYKDEKNYYRAYLDGSYVGIMKMVNGTPTYPSDWRVPLATNLDTYYSMDVRVKENIFEIWVDDIYRLVVVDDNPIPTGKAGCGVNSEHAHFDDIWIGKWHPWVFDWTVKSQINENILMVPFEASESLGGGRRHMILLTWSIL